MAATYPHDIPSVYTKHPGLPPALGPLDLNREIREGDVINRNDLSHACAVAQALKGLQDSGDPFTYAVAQSADLRRSAIEASVYTAEYTPGNLYNTLQMINNSMNEILERLGNVDDRLNDMETSLALIAATSANTRIISRNRTEKGLQNFLPLKKTVPGHGAALAAAALPPNSRVNPPGPPAQMPLVGSTPPNYNHDIPNYNNRNILDLIVFYNENFSILPADSLPVRIEKFRRFLSDL